MKILSIDTSICGDLLTLFDNSKAIFHKTFGKEQKSSHLLMLNIKETLLSYGLSLNDIDAIAIGLGPGSFLGTRIGVIIAKTLAYALDIQLVGFCSLSLYAPNNDGVFYSLSDAKSKGVYALKGEKNEHQVIFEETPSLIDPEDFNFLKEHPLITADLDLYQKAPELGLPIEIAKLTLESHLKYLSDRLKPSGSYDFSKDSLDIHYLRLS